MTDLLYQDRETSIKNTSSCEDEGEKPEARKGFSSLRGRIYLCVLNFLYFNTLHVRPLPTPKEKLNIAGILLSPSSNSMQPWVFGYKIWMTCCIHCLLYT